MLFSSFDLAIPFLVSAIGLSEYVSVLENLEMVLTEGLAAKLYHPEFVAKFISKYQNFDMSTATKVLNPNQDTSSSYV